MQAETATDSTNFGPGSSTYTVTTTHSFTRNVIGISEILSFQYSNTYSRVDRTQVHYSYFISGSNVTVISRAAPGSTSHTGYVRTYVTALVEES